VNINLTLIGQSIAFAIFVWFCMKYVWPPLLKALQDREAKIADGLAAAEKGRHDLELAEERAKEVLREGKGKAQEYIDQAQRRASEIVEEAKDQAREEGERLLVAARAEIEQERNKAREELRREVGTLAISAAEQILMREVDQARHGELLESISARL